MCFSPVVHTMAGYLPIGLLCISILLGTREFQKRRGNVGCHLLTPSHVPSWELLSEFQMVLPVPRSLLQVLKPE